MVGDRKAVARPVFIDAPSRRLFGLYVAPHAGAASLGRAALYVPPFAEEMNRSRRMAALQARALASIGIGTLLLDLFGTGDGSGDFGSARLPLWLEDIAVAADWLDGQGGAAVCLWGLRFGALLSAQAAARQPSRFKHLLLWQPVIDGKAMLTQFLRIRVAAAMGEGGAAEKTEDLRNQLAAGSAVEVAGYEIAPELAQAMDELRLDRLGLAGDRRVDWIEAGGEASDRILPAGERVADVWRKAGIAVSTKTVPGDPFWTLQETTLAPEMLAATTAALQSCLT